jgi:hypothetical protein
MHGAIRARILAERAVKHSSTLQHLNFPVEQRYAIYVPLFLPVFVHVSFFKIKIHLLFSF